MKHKDSWMARKKREFRDYKEYVHNLEQRYGEALDELQNIAVGLVLPEDGEINWPIEVKLRRRAARFLRLLAQKPKKEKGLFYL